MSEEDKGKKFLELIEKQNKIQWDVIQKLSQLIQHNWNSPDSKKDIEDLIDEYEKISKELNGLDEKNNTIMPNRPSKQ